jgi:hypothetical protein
MQNAMDWQIEEHGEDWSENDELWEEFFDDLAESVACGYAGGVEAAITDQVVEKSLEELAGREDWRISILIEAQEYQKRWREEDENKHSDQPSHL